MAEIVPGCPPNSLAWGSPVWLDDGNLRSQTQLVRAASLVTQPGDEPCVRRFVDVTGIAVDPARVTAMGASRCTRSAPSPESGHPSVGGRDLVGALRGRPRSISERPVRSPGGARAPVGGFAGIAVASPWTGRREHRGAARVRNHHSDARTAQADP